MTVKGAMVAAAVAGLFAVGTPAVVHAKGGKKINCTGVNDCKGKGWTKMSEKDCTAKGGTAAAAEEPAKK